MNDYIDETLNPLFKDLLIKERKHRCMKIPKSAPTLQRMNNGLNQPDDRVMTEPNLDYGSMSLFVLSGRTAERQDSEHLWEATTCSNIEPEPLSMERLDELLELVREAPLTQGAHSLSLIHVLRHYMGLHRE